jgi:hypothetical protein
MNISFDPSAEKRIGIYMLHPRGELWGMPFGQLLSRTLANSLRSNSVKVFNESGVLCLPFFHELFSMIRVDDLSTALKTIVADLTALQLLDGAEIAWMNTDEGAWVYEYPKTGATPFETRIVQLENALALHQDLISAHEQLAKLRKMATQRPQDKP